MNKGSKHTDNQVDYFSEDMTYDASICIMTKIIDLMSGRWKPIILYLIKNDVNRFGLLQKKMPKISKKVLTNQLRDLERDNLISREIIEAKHPQIIVYHLTEKGRSLRNLIDEMINWGLLNLMPVDHQEVYRNNGREITTQAATTQNSGQSLIRQRDRQADDHL